LNKTLSLFQFFLKKKNKKKKNQKPKTFQFALGCNICGVLERLFSFPLRQRSKCSFESEHFSLLVEKLGFDKAECQATLTVSIVCIPSRRMAGSCFGETFWGKIGQV
jgi:hypothetical protein